MVIGSRGVSEEVTSESTESRVPGLLGLARRAGGIAAGTEAVREAIRAGKARLVVVATDVSPAQSAKVRRTLAGHPVRNVAWGSRSELGAAVGLAPLSAVAVTHARLAAEMLELLETRTAESYSGVEA
jgi:ribosomal protein L7Ae-like RNA K-turn-binding protein